MIRELIAVKKKEGLAQSTIRNIAAPVGGKYNQAIEDGITERNPAARIGKLNKQSKDEPKKKIDPFIREEVAMLFTASRDGKYAHWYPLLLCARRSGLRMGVIKKKGEVIRATKLEPSNLRKAFHRILVDAGLRRVRFHDIRHTFASLLLQQGKSLAYVKDQMGHSSIQVTVDIYGHLVPGGNRAAVDKLDAEVTVGTASQ